MGTFFVVDLETQNKEYYGNLASPFHQDNYIVAAGWAVDSGPVGHAYFNSRAEADASDWFERELGGCSILVAHNATFELHWFMHRHYAALMKFLKRGGRIFCTQLAEYLLSNQLDTYPALDEVAPKYGGTHKVDAVKLLWEQGALTSQIDKDLLLEYLAGPSGDIENTRKVCFGQYRLLEERGMLPMFWERMDALLFNAFCTFNGLYVNLPVAHANHQEQLAQADELRKQVSTMFPVGMPTELEFNFGSDYHMSAWLFGGPVKYKVKVPYDPIKYEKDDFYMFGATPIKVSAIESGEVYFEPSVIHYGNADRYKSGKNKGELKIHRLDTDVEKLKWGEAVYNFPGLIRLADLPSHVSEQYIGKRAEFRGKRTLCDDETPVYSTGKDSLDLLAAFTDVAKPLKQLAQLDKDNTYYIVHKYAADGSIKESTGMLTCVGSDSIIHHSLNMTSTITGRLSSSNPNLQNIPRDGTSKVKQMFTSRFGDDGRIVEVDFTALEVVDMAAISGDTNLLDKLLSGTDMHCYRLAGAKGYWNGFDYNQLVAINSDKKHEHFHIVHEARTGIKPKAFAAQYGASDYGISYATGCTLEEARDFLANEAALFPQATNFSRDYVRPMVEETGSGTSGLCYEQTAEGAWKMYRRGYFESKGGTRYSFRTYKQWKNGTDVDDYKDTQLANYWCQGEGSFIVQTACGRVIRWLIANDFYQGCVLPINTVHDAIYLDCVNSEWAIYAGKYTESLMSSTPKYMCDAMPAYKGWRYDTTPFPAVAEYGVSMYDKVAC